jgi:hypothetical protein
MLLQILNGTNSTKLTVQTHLAGVTADSLKFRV